MGVFKDAEQLYQCIGGLLEMGKSNTGMAQKVNKAALVTRFYYEDPISQITVDSKSPEANGSYIVTCGESDVVPDVQMYMKADVAHLFWFGKVNLMAALAKGIIKSKGPISKSLALLPAIKPSYAMYPVHLKNIGLEDLIR